MISEKDIIGCTTHFSLGNLNYILHIRLIDGSEHEVNISAKTATYFELDCDNTNTPYFTKIIKLLEHAGYDIELAHDYSI